MIIFYLKDKDPFARMKPSSGSTISHKEAGEALSKPQRGGKGLWAGSRAQVYPAYNIVKQTHNIEELKALPGLRCHPLKGDRQAQWAIKLTGFYRLIFTLEGETMEIVRIGGEQTL